MIAGSGVQTLPLATTSPKARPATVRPLAFGGTVSGTLQACIQRNVSAPHAPRPQPGNVTMMAPRRVATTVCSYCTTGARGAA